MMPLNTDSRSVEQGLPRRKQKHIHKIGCRLVSDVEAAAVPSLQFWMPTGRARHLPPYTFAETSLNLNSPRLPNHALTSPSWGMRGSRLTGNVFVDYRRFAVRRLEDLQELQRSREAEAVQSLSLAPNRAVSRFHSAAVTRLSLDCTRRYLLSSSRDGSIALYDLEADAAWNLNGGFGPEPKVYPIGYVQRRPDRPPKRNLLPLRFQPASGRRVTKGRTISSVAGNSLASSENFVGIRRAQAGHSRSVTSVEFMPGDNGMFASTGLDKLLKIWDTQAWDCVLDIAVDSPILCCAFERVGFQSKAAFSSTDSVENSVESPAHLPLATGCEDGSVRIFDMRCGVAQQTLLGHNGAVLSVAWDPACPSQLFSGSSDKAIRKWDIRRSDACMLIFDKCKPDIEFFRNRCSQSAAFRQLLHTYDVVGGRCSPAPALPYVTVETTELKQAVQSTSSDQGATLDIVARAAADAAFAQEPVFPLPRSSSAGLGFSLVTSGVSHFKTPHLQVPVLPRKRNQNSAGTMPNLGRGSKRTKVEEKAPQQYRFPSSTTAGMRGSLSDEQSDCVSPEYVPSIGLMEGTVQARERGKRTSAALLKKDNLRVFGLSNTGGTTYGEAPGNLDCLREPILSKSNCISNTKPKKRLHPATTVSPPKCRLVRSDSPTRVHSESVNFPVQIPFSQGPIGTASPQLEPSQRGGAELTCSGVCSPLGPETVPGFEGNVALKVPVVAQHAVGKRAHHCDPMRFDRSGQSVSGLADTPSSYRNSPSAAVESGQLFCGVGSPPKSAPAFSREGTCGLFHRFGNRLTDSLCTGPASILQGQNVWSKVSAHDGAVTCLIPSPDGTYLVSSGSDGRVRLWNALNGSHCFVHMILNIPRSTSVHASFQDSNRSRISGIPSRPEKSNTTTNRFGSIWSVQAAMSKSGEYLIHGRGRVLCTFDIMSGAELQLTSPGHSDDIICVTWNDEKNEAYSGAFDGSVLIYDAMCVSGGYTSEEAEEDDEVPVVDVTPPEFS